VTINLVKIKPKRRSKVPQFSPGTDEFQPAKTHESANQKINRIFAEKALSWAKVAQVSQCQSRFRTAGVFEGNLLKPCVVASIYEKQT
jgi:hypothetical protein